MARLKQLNMAWKRSHIENCCDFYLEKLSIVSCLGKTSDAETGRTSLNMSVLPRAQKLCGLSACHLCVCQKLGTL